ncbi:hypothetical protein MSG28_006233 [Choristoneura fumiferana]|uniref:Uncharacterized protein n=1 Tax=Choristoneura fumiferana TaxID=7141 RepID=A0ACC0JE39_CHOFU|nr:hypothetical protein MSG28_006233 [Choristoneura fumiferana]
MILIYIALLVASVAANQKVDEFSYNYAYDYDLYENVLDPELCQKHLQEMRAFESNVTWSKCSTIWSDHNLKAYKDATQKFATLAGEDRVLEGIIIAHAVPMTLAVCIPRSCRVEDVLSPLLDSSSVEFNYTNLMCRLPDDKPYSGADIAAVVIFSILGCLTILSTGYELHHIFIKKETIKPSEILSCFSVYSNTDRLMTINTKPGVLDCLDGIRSLSILWVIVGHTFLVHAAVYLTNGLDSLKWQSQLSSVWITGAGVAVDSFFTLSGLLLVYTVANKMKQMQLLKNLHLFYLNRLLRMFPLLAAAVLLQASVFHQVTDGVRWDRVAWETQKCRDYWWSALLHLQNIVNPRNMCLTHTWYLSVDVQLHILSPLILFWVLGTRRSAWSGLTAGLLASLAATITYCFIKQFSGLHDTEYSVYFYHNTMTRSPAFIIGMIFGYMLHISRGKQVEVSRWTVILGYLLALMMSAYCMYQEHASWDSQLWINFNTALMRAAWALSLCWLVYACVNGYGGPINWFLSLKLWKFVGRISYALYIFHYPMQFITRGANIMPIYFTFENMFLLFASDVAYAVIVSIAACVLIDGPLSTLLRMLVAAVALQKPPAKIASQKEVFETKPTESKDESQPKKVEGKQ